MRAAVRIIVWSIRIISFAAAAAAAFLIVLFLAGNRFYIVRSGSMEPAVHTGDLIVVNSGYDYGKLIPGDVITYEAQNGALVTHRVIAVTEKGLETKGDANNISDGVSADPGNYRGREWLSLPKLGFVCAVLLGKKGRILLITAAAALLIISFFPREEEKKTEERRENRNEKPA